MSVRCAKTLLGGYAAYVVTSVASLGYGDGF